MLRALGLVLVLAAAAAAKEEVNAYASLLQARGIDPDRVGIAGFLRSCVPNAETPALIRSLIAGLVGDDPVLREVAVRRLSVIPYVADAAVRKVADSGDPELRRLTRRILRAHESSRYDEILHAVFHTIRIEGIRGLAELILDVLPHCEDDYLVMPATRALVVTSRRRDAPLLRAALASRYPRVRVAALGALAEADSKRCSPALVPLLKDRNNRVALTAAELLARLGKRSGFSTLVRLLDSADSAVRRRAATVLRAVSGRRFDFDPYASAEEREAAVGRWKEYIDRYGARFRLQLPLRMETEPRGRTLICVLRSQTLQEYDLSGRKVFESKKLALPWGCQGLPNGHRLVAVYNDSVVLEINASGVEVWRTPPLPGKPMSVRRLENGGTLISCGDSGRVVEIGPRGRTLWNILLGGRPIDARRLENGRTLVTLHRGQRVVEVDRQGKVLWQLRGKAIPVTAQRLANGDTIVAGLEGAGTVTVYRRNGRVVWRARELGNVYEAQRLPNGHTLVGTADGARELDAHGKVVWKLDLGACRIMRY